MPRQTFRAGGLTCGHCAVSVAAEVGSLGGIDSVGVNMLDGGEALVTIDASRLIEDPEVMAALCDAGGYVLVRSRQVIEDPRRVKRWGLSVR